MDERILVTMFTESFWRQFEVALWNGHVSMAQKEALDLTGAQIGITTELYFSE